MLTRQVFKRVTQRRHVSRRLPVLDQRFLMLLVRGR